MLKGHALLEGLSHNGVELSKVAVASLDDAEKPITILSLEALRIPMAISRQPQRPWAIQGERVRRYHLRARCIESLELPDGPRQERRDANCGGGGILADR